MQSVIRVDAQGRGVILKAIRRELGLEPVMARRIRIRKGVLELEPEPA